MEVYLILIPVPFIPVRERKNGAKKLPVIAPQNSVKKSKFKINFWNAGGMKDKKLVEFENEIYKNKPDVFIIIDAGSLCEKEDDFELHFNDYQLKTKKRDRRISSGIIVGIKINLTRAFRIIKEMTNTDRMEAIYIATWKDGIKYPCIAVYNPPNNLTNYDLLTIENDSIVCGDFNSPSTRWNYKNTTRVGKHMEDFIDNSPLDEIASSLSTDYTFLSPTGSRTNPDLVLAHNNISRFVKQKSLTLLGSIGHKVIEIKIEIEQQANLISQENPFTSWNLKKANWEDYQSISATCLQADQINKNSDVAERNIRSSILQCAKANIPRGQVFNYKPFWNDTIEQLSRKRDEAVKIAERSWSIENANSLKECQDKLEKAILDGKKSNFDEELEKLNYRSNGSHTHRKVSTFNDTESRRSNEAIEHDNRLLTSDREKGKAFLKHYTKVSSGTSKIRKYSIRKSKTPFTFKEFEEASETLKKDKAPGPDGILPEFILKLDIQAKVVLLAFLNFVLFNGIPAIWRKATIVPILKPKKKANKLASYRPVALTSIICKLYEKMIMNRLKKELQEKRLLHPAQGAFQQHKSSIDQARRTSPFNLSAVGLPRQ